MMERHRDVHEAICKLFEVSPEFVDNVVTLPSPNPNDTVEITKGIYEDSGLFEWSQKQCTLRGGGKYLWHTLAHPVTNTDLLKDRQRLVIQMGTKKAKIQGLLDKLKDLEDDLLWVLNMRDVKDAWPLNHLFPSMWIAKYINYNPHLLNAYHLYRIALSPSVNVVSPLMTLFAPWMYLKKTMGIPLTLASYLQFLWMAAKVASKTALSDLRLYIGKIVTVFAYMFFYFFGIVQSVQYASMLYKMRKSLLQKAQALSQFVATFHELAAITTQASGVITKVKANVTSIYVFMTHAEKREHIRDMLTEVYKIDAHFVATKKLFAPHTAYCIPRYTEDKTVLYGMGHVMLQREVRNPCDLGKSLIITGPNAAGKTTYTKALCSNIILAQSLGIVKALKASVAPVHAIGSFMRVHDEVGNRSLFEAEVERCADICRQAEKASVEGRRSIYFLDEPMHSTPPIEGTATAFAVMEHLGKLPGVKVVLTTHYHTLRFLETEAPLYFKNVSMEAFERADGGFVFPYKLRRGHSMQCIALELLSTTDLEPRIKRRAIEIKNKLCKQSVNEP
jgi:hypothetical protein